MVESFVIGAVASVIGLVVGLGLALLLFALFNAAGFTLPNTGIVLRPRTVIVAILVGVIVTMLASLRPAIRATRVDPIAAVREGATLPGRALCQVPHVRVDRDRGARRDRARDRPVRGQRHRARCSG